MFFKNYIGAIIADCFIYLDGVDTVYAATLRRMCMHWYNTNRLAQKEPLLLRKKHHVEIVGRMCTVCEIYNHTLYTVDFVRSIVFL